MARSRPAGLGTRAVAVLVAAKEGAENPVAAAAAASVAATQAVVRVVEGT